MKKRNNFISTVAIALSTLTVLGTSLASSSAAYAAGQPIFSDDFSSGKLDKWFYVAKGSDKQNLATIENGECVIKSATDIKNAYVFNNKESTDYVVDFDVTPLTLPTNNSAFMLTFRCTGNINAPNYSLFMNKGNILFRKGDTLIGEKHPMTFTPGTKFHITLRAEGSKFTASVNNKPVLTVSDSSIAKGGFMLRTIEASAKFDNFVVSPLDGSAAPALPQQGGQATAPAKPVQSAPTNQGNSLGDAYGLYNPSISNDTPQNIINANRPSNSDAVTTTPSKPAAPSTPSKPAAPSTPSKPATPSTPAKPAAPSTSNTSSNRVLKGNFKQLSSGRWVFVKDDSTLASGWFKTEDNKWYYCDYYGILSVDTWVNCGNNKWCLTDDQGNPIIGWGKSPYSGLWYYFDEEGYMVTNTTVDGYSINSQGVADC